MTIQEAIKSGKNFYRPHFPVLSANSLRITLNIEDALANDWEVEEPSVKLTLSAFQQAYSRAEQRYKFGESPDSFMNTIAAEMGFKL